MLDLGTMQVTIKADSEQAKKEVKDFKKEAEGVRESLKPIGNAAKTASVGILAIGAAAVGAVESTREYRTEQAKLDTAFETAGHSAEAASETYSAFYGILGDSGQAVEASNHLAKLCDNEKDLAAWTDVAAGVYGTFGDSLPIEGLMEAANETSKTGSLTGGLADALNWAGISEEEFQGKLDGCSTAQERQNLILDTLSGAYQEASANYQQNAQDVIAANEANAALEEGMATLGGALEPVITAVKEFVAGGLEKLASVVSENQGAIDSFVGAIQDFGNFIVANKETIIAGLAGIGAGLVVFNVASTIMGVVSAVKAFQAANEGATVAQAILNAVMNANPLAIVISVIAAIVTAIITFITTNEEAREKIAAAWDAICEWVTGAIDDIVGFFASFPDKIREYAEWYKETSIEIFEKIKEGFEKVWETICEWFTTAITTVTDTITGIGTDLFEAGKSIFTSLWDGIKKIWKDVSGWVSDKVGWLVDQLTFWDNGTAEMASGDDGSHRTGLREVPFDGYKAELHRGEMILTAAEANQYQAQNTNLINALGAQLAMVTQGSNQPQTINLTLDIGGTKFGETIVNLGDATRNALGVSKVVKMGV